MKNKKLLIFYLIIANNLIGFSQSDNDSIQAKYNERISLDTINGVYIPLNLEDCFSQIDDFWSDSIKTIVSSLTEEEFCTNAHFGFGMWMRNNWGLWGGSRLQVYFNNKGIYHPDDMSGIILTSYHRYLTGEKISVKKQIKESKTYLDNSENYKSFTAKTEGNKEYVDLDAALLISESIIEIDLIGYEKTPRKLKKFKNLKELNIESCPKIRLEKTFKFISSFDSLEYISFFDNGFSSYPSSLGNLKQLNKLWISGDSITELPNSIINLSGLVDLNITECPKIKLDTLFRLLARLDNLKELDLSENGLNDLPQSISNLMQLTDLWLDNNEFKSVPESVKSLSNLEYLRFFSNDIESLNISSGDLISLKGINLCYNKFKIFPMELTHLKNLESVVMWYNEISTIPEEITKLDNLTRLNLHHNNLTDQQKDKLKMQLPNTKLEL